jgi:capsular exopolysaccharide synthesis family protein
MTRVFEALRREQESRKKTAIRDPLAAETGAPGEAPEAETGAAEFEESPLIGSPTGPRSNEGMVFPAINLGNGVEDRPIGAAQSAKRRVARSNGHGAKENSQRPQPETQQRQEEKTVARPAREIQVERLVPSRLHQRLILLTEPSRAECEQYRTLRTQLFHAAEKKQTQVVVITSALAGEGKTATALNLALAIAQSKEHRALVVDGDLRRPNIASYLGLRSRVGFNEVLADEVGALDAIVCLDDPELYVLPVNREAANPTELLSSERLVETIRELREYFDFIIVDSPPVAPFADARLLANLADAVILVVRAGMAPYETVEKAIDALPAGRVMGVALNGAEHIRETDYYDYYYSYAQREQRRGALLGKLSGRIRQSWLGRKMKL